MESLLDPWTGRDLTGKVSDLLEKTSTHLNLAQALSRVISTRNTWTGHGAMRSLYEYKLKTEDEECYLYSFIDRFKFLAEYNSFLVLASDYDEFADGDYYSISVFNGLGIQDDDLQISRRLAEGQREHMIRYLYFHNTKTNKIVNLYPFLSYMFCQECKRENFFFYNGVKSPAAVSYLSFECGHSVKCSNYEHFQRRLAIGGVTW
jgi:hypothetical protein